MTFSLRNYDKFVSFRLRNLPGTVFDLVDLYKLAVVDNPRFAVRIPMLSASSRNITISWFGGHIVISGRPSVSHLLMVTFFDLAVVENFVFVTRITTVFTLQPFTHISQILSVSE